MIPCLPSEVLAALFHLPPVAELTAGHSSKENGELLLAGKKGDLFFLKGKNQHK